MFNEMMWQKKLRGNNQSYICYHFHQMCLLFWVYFTARPSLFWVSSFMSLWSNILFNCAVIINLIVAFFYPFDHGSSDSSGESNGNESQRGRMIWGK